MSHPGTADYPSPAMACARLTGLLLLAAVALAACGSAANRKTRDPSLNLPSDNGIRASVQQASDPAKGQFPSPGGKTLQQLSQKMSGGPTLAMASSQFDTGHNRIAFGVIGRDGRPVYGPTALYVAVNPGAPAKGPYVAPADVLLTDARYRSKQAATAADPFVAVYGALGVPFAKSGRYAVLAATRGRNGKLTGSGTTITVAPVAQDPIPRVGQKAPKVHTDTLAGAGGDVRKIDTRDPPDDMHKVDFADVVGKKPVALLFATPQLCQSRVCGPVTDIAYQMEAKYGSQMDFIHQEVYVDNNPAKGLRKPLQEFGLRTEPWLFVVNKQGRITARLEGSIGVRQFEAAVKSGL
jgi:hypothetical protein